MDTLFIFAIAVGLAMDAFAVSVSAGVCERSNKFPTSIKLAVVFGGFQGGMCILGWFAGRNFNDLISSYDHWIAFILLLAIGLKMIYEGFYGTEEKVFDLTAPLVLIILGIATSIDSLAVGLSFAFLDMDILAPAFIIAIVTLVLSLAGYNLGGKFGDVIGKRAEIIGGCILILLGIKIIIESI
ncbi:protein of unknown function DUF204 [Methanolacinia petrolearia DSM 11571]|uniref:Putative manganese efflux pump MntP n=2 Tax=Methanolacinia TaxID=230355 RepID=E1RIN3_METP4|nr:protein of unknown function DUF204 [Methanolacinia petrolearia DSM 11571]